MSAYSELEYRLRKYESYDDGRANIRAPFRLESFISRYATNDVDRDIQHAREYRMIRNNIVHNQYVAARKEAESFLRFTEALLAQLTSAVE